MFYNGETVEGFLKDKQWEIIRQENFCEPLRKDDVVYYLDCYTMKYLPINMTTPVSVYVDDFNFFFRIKDVRDLNKEVALRDLSESWRKLLLEKSGVEYGKYLLDTCRKKKGFIVDKLERSYKKHPESVEELRKNAMAKITELSKLETEMLLYVNSASEAVEK